MATASLGRSPSPSLFFRLLDNFSAPPKPPSSLSSLSLPPCLTSHFTSLPMVVNERRRGCGSRPLLAFPGQEQVASYSEELNGEDSWAREDDEEEVKDYERTANTMNFSTPCELYVCNLPKSFDVAEIAEMFSPFGTVTAVQVSKNPNTGQSKGAAYVTIASSADAKKAAARLEGTDVGGREIRVRFSTEMKNVNGVEMNKKTITDAIYQGRYQLYVGNLPWSTKPEEVWDIFREFGTVASVRVVYDRRTGRLRVYAFVSYNTEKELEAALSMTRKSINGRQMALRRFGKTDKFSQ